MNELDMIKLNIYEAFENGEITYGEKEYLLEKVHPAAAAGVAIGAGISAGIYGGLGALIGAGVSKSKIRKVYDQQHADEMAAAQASGNMSEYIAKREAAIKAAGKAGAKKGAKIGAGVGLVGSAASAYKNRKEIAALNNDLNSMKYESTFDLLLESIDDLYYDEY